jgi:hypothetical protein
MEFNLTIKNDVADDPDVVRMCITIDGTQSVGGIRISPVACAELLGRVALCAGFSEPLWLLETVRKQEHLLERYRKKTKKHRSAVAISRSGSQKGRRLARSKRSKSR